MSMLKSPDIAGLPSIVGANLTGFRKVWAGPISTAKAVGFRQIMAG